MMQQSIDSFVYSDSWSSIITCNTKKYTPATWIQGTQLMNSECLWEKKNREKERKVQECLDYRVNILLLLQEFHFETMARATHNAESASVASTDVSHQVASRILDSWYPVLVQFSLTDIFRSPPFFLLLSWQGNQWKPHLTEPKPPLLHTSLRARPTQVKSSLEIENEELEKIPKFKAKPLNKKVLSSFFRCFYFLQDNAML